MTAARWQSMRIQFLQTLIMEEETALEAHLPTSPQRTARAFRRLVGNSQVLRLLPRYETTCQRQFHRALKALLDLRATSKTQVFADDLNETANLIFPNEPNFTHIIQRVREKYFPEFQENLTPTAATAPQIRPFAAAASAPLPHLPSTARDDQDK